MCTNCFDVDAVSVTDEKIIRRATTSGVHSHGSAQALDYPDCGGSDGDQDTSKHKIWVTFYDPLGVASNPDVCQAKWISLTLPLLQQWFDRDAGEIGGLQDASSTPERAKTTLLPCQTQIRPPAPVVLAARSCCRSNCASKTVGSVSCDIVSIAQAYSYMYVTRDRSLKTSNSNSQKDMAQMRLRLLDNAA
ncbi:hypothetical protein GQ600_730 [Phytophthora cactorum]|nr:hypothetical protein GQ600_730 [Phytophthora cactorum]